MMTVVIGTQKPSNLHLNYFHKKKKGTYRALILSFTVVPFSCNHQNVLAILLQFQRKCKISSIMFLSKCCSTTPTRIV